MNNLSLRDLKQMNKDNLMNLFLSLQEFTHKTLRENADLKGLLEIRRKLDFASSSEKLDDQLPMLFDELDVERVPPQETESTSVTVQSHTRKKQHRKVSLPADAPVVTIDHTESAPSCQNCGGDEMIRVEDKVVDRMGYQPARRYIERHVYAQYRCDACEAEASDGEQNVAAPGFHPQVDGLMAAPSLVAHAAVQKFADGLPLYRQSGMLKRDGMEISRQTLSNWLLRYWELLKPLNQKLKEHILQAPLINQDETAIKVLNPADEASSKNNFMVVQAGTSEDRRAILFTYVSNRRIRTIDSLLEGYQHFVQTDGLKGYNHLSRHIGCWVHAVRQLKQILKVNPKAEAAQKLCNYAAMLYIIEREEREKAAEQQLTKEQFLANRRERAEGEIRKIKAYADSIRPNYTKGSAMGKALNYLYEYWPTLTRYLDCYEATPSNNLAENSIRPFVLGRKSWLFANTVNGADASALYYSLVETAKANKLNPYDYLWYLLEQAPSCRTAESWDSLLPWNIDISAIHQLKARRDSAAADPLRKESYLLRGSR